MVIFWFNSFLPSQLTSSMKFFILAARPKTLPAAIVPVWIGVVLAYYLESSWSPLLAFYTVMGSICIQIATNFFNDAIDSDKGADTEARLGPVRATASGQLSRRTVYSAAFACLIIAAAFGVPLILARGWPLFLIGLPSFYFAYGYTGGPLPLAYKGLGELFVILFFGLVAVTGTVFVQTGQWYFESILVGLAIGFLSAVLISINNLRDEEEDRGNHKNTLAVQWGRKKALILLYVMNISAYLCMIPLFGFNLLYFLPAALLGVLILSSVRSVPAGAIYNKYLALAALQLILFAGAFTWLAI